MDSPTIYSALGATIVFVGSLIQFVREVRGLDTTARRFNEDYEAVAKSTISDMRRQLRWFQLVAKWKVPGRAKREIRQSLPPDEVIILRDLNNFSWGWSFVAVGSLASAAAGWWQLATGG